MIGEEHGRVVIEYVNDPHDGHTYALTDTGAVFRKFFNGSWALFYTVNPDSLPEQVASLRAAEHQRITVDRWKGKVPDIERPGWYRRGKEGEQVTTATEKKAPAKAPAKAKAEPKPKAKTEKPKPKTQRLGARARKVLDGFGLTADRRAEVLAKADSIAKGRDDAMTRIWDVYEAAGEKMPDGIAAEKAEFLKTGRMPKSTTGSTKAKDGGQGNAPKGDKKTSPARKKTPSEGQASKQTGSGEQEKQHQPEEEVTL